MHPLVLFFFSLSLFLKFADFDLGFICVQGGEHHGPLMVGYVSTEQSHGDDHTGEGKEEPGKRPEVAHRVKHEGNGLS